MTVNNSTEAHLRTGRVNQKRRTRDTLVATAADLVGRGISFSVADVADLAKVGRTTAYRYFPTHEMLLAHATLWKVAHIESEEFKKVLRDEAEPAQRLTSVLTESDRSTTKYNREYRAMLRLSLDPESVLDSRVPRRGQIRQERIASALEPLAKQLGRKKLDRLTAALCLFAGIESSVVLQDICMLSADEAKRVKLWASSLLLQGAIGEAKQASAEGPRKA